VDNYPDYTWGGDPRAPWNKYIPECTVEDCDIRPDGYLECPYRGELCDFYECEVKQCS